MDKKKLLKNIFVIALIIAIIFGVMYYFNILAENVDRINIPNY